MSEGESKTRNGRRWIGVTVGVLALLAVAAGSAAWINGSGQASAFTGGLTYVAQREPLTISVTESGTIEARDRVVVKSQVEGNATIIYLIEEGTVVEEGDRLIEMDASSYRDQLAEERMELQDAEAGLVSAQSNLEVVKNQAQANIEEAELTYEFAKQDLEKYTAEGGEYEMQLEQAEAKITLAAAEMEQARETYNGSEELFAKKYISETELQGDKLAFDRAVSDHKLAIQEKRLLETYTKPRQMAQLQSDVRQAEMALERAKAKAKADIAQAQAQLNARQANVNRERQGVARLERQIENCTITAPTNGMVVYAPQGNRWNAEVLEEGMSVRERQELIYLPTAEAMSAEISVHESALTKVKVGQPVRLTVDALPNAAFTGEVKKIAIMAEDGGWRNPDLKQYETQIDINEVSQALRPGMTCQAEILIAHYPDVMTVPLQTVLRIDGEPTVFVVGPNGQPQPRAIEIGMDNNRKVHVKAGLEPGERVLLDPPLDRAEREAFGIPEDAEVEAAAGDDAQQDEEAADGEGAATHRPGAEAEAQEGEELATLLRQLQRLHEAGRLDQLELTEEARREVDQALEQLEQDQQPELSESVRNTLRMKMVDMERQRRQRRDARGDGGGGGGGARP
ncbi:MAG: efflux RND transporter periplasmic adaptor subunit [Phycisphaeraceae bacterium]